MGYPMPDDKPPQETVKAGVPSELHVFANGPHGTGLGKGDPALDLWPTLLENWLRTPSYTNIGGVKP